MKIIALDIGRRRTGAAFVDDAIGVPLALDTIQHEDVNDLIGIIEKVSAEKKVDLIVLGLPLLPSGSEGEQAEFVREVAKVLEEKKLRVVFLDERYTTDSNAQSDGDAKAAIELLNVYLKRQS